MKIGLLNAYHFVKGEQTYQTQYSPMAIKYLKSLADDVEVCEYVVAQGEFPEDMQSCDFWVITGSPKSAYDNDEWIEKLTQFICTAHEKKIKLLGICFGHQIIAKALGGEVKASNKGWGVGVRKSILKNKKQWMAPELDQFSLLYSHQDQVSRLPKEAEQLFFSDFCEFEAYQVGDHILSIQGHPEFTKVYARDRMVSRKSKLGEKLFYQARKSLLQETDQQTIGKWIVNFFSFT